MNISGIKYCYQNLKKGTKAHKRKRSLYLWSSALLSLSLLACSDHTQEQLTPLALHAATQSDIDILANTLKVTYEHVSNVPTDKCKANIADGACFEVKINFLATENITANNWAVYFSQITPIQSAESEYFTVTHINGDLHKIALTPAFNGLKAGETKSLTFRANFWSLSETDALPNYIVTSDDASALNIDAKVIESTRVVIDPQTGLEILPYVTAYTDYEKQFKRTASDLTPWLTSDRLYERNLTNKASSTFNVAEQLIPTPKVAIFDNQSASLDLSQGVKIQWNNVEPHQVKIAITRLTQFGITFLPKESEKALPLNLLVKEDKQKKIGSYTLNITASGIEVIGVDANGVFNGLQSIASLLQVGKASLPIGQVIDEPHYEFRGMLVDVARNFHSKEFILRLLDQMAAYKLNKLHLHLGDDEGWRLEIPSLPELTELGSQRCFDTSETTCLLPQLGAGVDTASSVNGYYSVADYQEILKEASLRYIQVIPSLDMPGHSRAAVKAMELRYQKYMALEQPDKALQYLLSDFDDKTVYSSVQYYNDNTINVCLESSYAFVEKVMQDVKQIHEEAGHPLTRYHIGADETAGAWLQSPKCEEFIAKHNAEITSASQLGAYFVERIANMLADMNIEPAAWIDGLEHTNHNNMPAVVQANAWNPLMYDGHKPAHKLANYNWQIVVSSPDVTYFDFPYEADPQEHGYYWAARHSNTQKMFEFMPDNLPVHAEFWLDREDKPYVADDTFVTDQEGKIISTPLNKSKTFLGVQGQLWSENTRTDATAEYKIYPRLLALAERGWHQANWAVPYDYQGFKYSQDTNKFTAALREKRDLAWSNFSRTLGEKEFIKLEKSGVNYRIPTVGAKIIAGQLHANTAFPGLPIEYREQGKAWKVYQEPIEVQGNIEVRSRTFDSSRAGRSLFVK